MSRILFFKIRSGVKIQSLFLQNGIKILTRKFVHRKVFLSRALPTVCKIKSKVVLASARLYKKPPRTKREKSCTTSSTFSHSLVLFLVSLIQLGFYCHFFHKKAKYLIYLLGKNQNNRTMLRCLI